MVVSDGQGRVAEVPGVEMAAACLNRTLLPLEQELIPLPHASVLYELPQRTPVGYVRSSKCFSAWRSGGRHRSVAVAAFLPPAHTLLYHPAYETQPGAPTLPLYAYAAVGWRDNAFWVPAVRVDADMRHDPAMFSDDSIEQGVRRLRSLYPANRLITHLIENCIQRYHCPNAQNLAIGRWECPVPVSPSCNAACLGCISKQAQDAVPSAQQRLTFTPTVEEILEYTVPHLQQAPHAMISFGQGCEGEPLLHADLLEAAIRKIREKTSKGTIHLNTNGAYPREVERLCRVGLDSVRFSMNSAQEQHYRQYSRPRDYGLDEVMESMRIARRYERWISLNYFIFPGLTDQPQEMEELLRILARYRVNCVQMRNLNIDPEYYIKELALEGLRTQPLGILNWMAAVKKQAPWIRFGYFNPAKETW